MANSCWCSDILRKVLLTFYSTIYDLLLFFGCFTSLDVHGVLACFIFMLFFSLLSTLRPSIINNDVRQSLCNLNVAHCAHKTLLFNVHDFFKHQTLSGFLSKSSSKNQTDSNAFIQHLWFAFLNKFLKISSFKTKIGITLEKLKLKIFYYIFTFEKGNRAEDSSMCIEKKKSKEEKRNEEKKNMFYGTSMKARLVCHTTAKFIYLIQTNGSFRKLVKYPPALCCFCQRFLQKPSFHFCALHAMLPCSPVLWFYLRCIYFPTRSLMV